jgi:hypothetical protein
MKKSIRILIYFAVIFLGYFLAIVFVKDMTILEYIFIDTIITIMHVLGNGVNKYIALWR